MYETVVIDVASKFTFSQADARFLTDANQDLNGVEYQFQLTKFPSANVKRMYIKNVVTSIYNAGGRYMVSLSWPEHMNDDANFLDQGT